MNHWRGLLLVLIIALIAMLLFGAGRLASLGKGLGEGIRNFKAGLREATDDEKAADADAESEPDARDSARRRQRRRDHR